MNLVGHVAVALTPPDTPDPSTEMLVGCMLPDLAAIARVRLARPDGELGRGVELHHASDAVFHESTWFHRNNCELRDALLDDGVATGPARACSHAGVEMLLDGALVDDVHVEAAAMRAFAAVRDNAGELSRLAPDDAQAVARVRFERIGSSLDPRRYRDVRFVAERLHGMTSGRRRIELPASDVDTVADALAQFRPSIVNDAPRVLDEVRAAVLVDAR